MKLSEQYKNLPIVPKNCGGGTYIVTGSNTGLGLEAAKHFVRLGAQTVIMAVRSKSKGEAAKAIIERDTGREGVAQVWQLDLGSYKSVIQFADRVKTELDRVDVLLQNASIAMDSWTEIEGDESSMRVNVYSTMLLAVLLLPKLRESAERHQITAHLTVVGSEVAFFGQYLNDIDGDIFEKLSTEDDKLVKVRYPTTKQIQLFAVRELASRNQLSASNVVINFVNPGFCATELGRDASLKTRWMLIVMRIILGRTAEMGSRTLLHGAFAGKESHGKYLSSCEVADNDVPDWITNAEGQKNQKRVWQGLERKLEQIVPGCVGKSLA